MCQNYILYLISEIKKERPNNHTPEQVSFSQEARDAFLLQVHRKGSLKRTNLLYFPCVCLPQLPSASEANLLCSAREH